MNKINMIEGKSDFGVIIHHGHLSSFTTDIQNKDGTNHILLQLCSDLVGHCDGPDTLAHCSCDCRRWIHRLVRHGFTIPIGQYYTRPPTRRTYLVALKRYDMSL